MRFSYAESMITADQFVPLAKAAEESGYTSFTVPDSIIYPEVSDSKYPYTPDGNREFLEGKPMIDPFVLASTLAAVTETLRFTTFVMKLPIRQPVLMAKQAMSLAVMSGNRFGFGIGLSPWPEDYAVTGTEWKARGKRFDEMIDVIRGLETGEYFEYHGDFYDFQSIKMCPAPTERIPLLIGGHADAALKRAARVGDGWMHAGGDPEELKGYLAKLTDYRKQYGTESKAFEIHVISLDGFTPDGIKRLEDLGVTDTIVGFRNAYEEDKTTLDQKLEALRRYGDAVIAKL